MRTTRDAGVAKGGEEGQVMILVLGYTVLCLLVITVVAAVSGVYIGQKKLLSAADGAAAAAADSFALGAASGGGTGVPRPELDDRTVAAAVAEYLARTGAATRFEDLAVLQAGGSADGQTAEVTLSAVVRPPIINWIIPAGIPVTAASDARTTLTR